MDRMDEPRRRVANAAIGLPILLAAPTDGRLVRSTLRVDRINQRYIVIMEYGASSATISDIDVAVSRDSDPKTAGISPR
jgi:hypothetical protein